MSNGECDLCGASEHEFVLSTPRLEGPLVRCRLCRLLYVLAPGPSPDGAARDGASEEMRRLASRARELELIDEGIEEGEGPWRRLTAAERLADLQRFVGSGRLLEVGCATGEMLAAAAPAFEATGVEADEGTSRVARARGLDCRHGTLDAACFPSSHFDITALYHVIEHLPSPRRAVRELHRVLRPGGWLVLETPNEATLWFHLLGARWRQIIPDHRYFFSPETVARLCGESGFEIRELRPVGKAMSVRLFISRVGRYHRPLARTLGTLSRRLGIEERTLRLNLGDVMRLYARKR
jgi:SAM-dependent methyltransferase